MLPEYSIAAIVAFPILKKLSPEATVEENEREERSARDMIGTMALLYQKKYSENIDALERSFEDLSRIVRSGSVHGADYEDYKSAVFGVAEDFCKSCQGRDYCIAENVNPCVKNSEKITKKMLSGEAILPEDINLDDEFCQYPEEMATALTRAAAMVKRENYRRRELVDNESYGLVSRLIREARAQDEAEKAVNPYKSDQLSAVISEFGFGSGASRVFGDKRLHIFVAVEDDGEKISSKELKESIERGLDISLGTPEFFKKDSMILMECSEEPRFNVEYAMARRSARDGECSGDTLRFVETEGGMIYSLISDGMGQGKEAAETSLFVADFLEKMLEFSSSGDGVIHLLNRALRQRNSECSATVDLFGFDRYSKEATFLKSGAASSYVKRDGSIFRIRSKTAPLGILSAIDTEKIKVEVKEGDMIIMISDGICQGEDTKAWLVDLLSRPAPRTSAAYAELILKEAEKNEELLDDMSVAVLKIVKNG